MSAPGVQSHSTIESIIMPNPSLQFLGAAAVAVLALVCGVPALAQTATVPAAVSAAVPAASRPADGLIKMPTAPATGLGVTPGETSFYRELGGKAGVDAIVAEFVTIMLEDKRLNATFEGVDLDRLHAKLVEQFCAVSGGPCVYTGKSMAESHEDLKVNNAQFNASVENLQRAMERRGVPSRIQNRLLARLAPTQREIVTR